MRKTILISTMAAIASLALVGCGSSGGDDSSPQAEYHPYNAPAISEAQKAEFLNAVNTVRAVGRTCGVHGYFSPAPALSWNDALYRAAYEHSEDMASTGYFSHDGSGTEHDWTAQIMETGRGSYTYERTANNGFSGATGENVVMGAFSTSAAIATWLDSDGHCLMLMHKDMTQLGMAKVDTYFTQVFGY